MNINIKEKLPQSWKNIYHNWQSYLANVKYGFPGQQLKVIGVTGTDGKTTTATMIYEIMKEAGMKVGLLTTVSAKIGKKELDTGFHVTTPDPYDMPRFLKMMLDAGLKWLVLEVTSHGLDQNRVAYINFENAVFTNITHEHLDYHRTWKALAEAKTKLISLVREGGDIIYKEDAKGGKFIAKKINKSKLVLLPVICNDSQVKKKEITLDGLKFNYPIKRKETEVFIPILGEYNIANAQCAIKATEDLVTAKDITESLRKFKGIVGRMQVIRRKKPAMIIVDFAHTPNALKNALETTRSYKGKGKLIVVFGCAGLRDKEKREKMGKIAAKLADVVIISSEDPRIENLSKINDRILSGIKNYKKKLIKRFGKHNDYKAIEMEKLKEIVKRRFEMERTSIFVFDQESTKSREDAIDLAIKIADSVDIVIVTGKGHEKSMCFGKKEYAWSDVEETKKAVRSRYSK